MSESLAWEKWSAFSHNRYQEELEKFSKPGSVAQKKAYFEAHYKRKAAQKAAAELEEANTVSVITQVETEDKSCTNSCVNSEPLRPNNQAIDRVDLEPLGPNIHVIDCIDSEPLKPKIQVIDCVDSEPLRPNIQVIDCVAVEPLKPNNQVIDCVNSEPLRPSNQVIETSEQKNFVQNAEFDPTDADAHDSMNDESMVETDKVEEVLVQNNSMETAPNVENANQNEKNENHGKMAVAEDDKIPVNVSVIIFFSALIATWKR